MISHAKQFAALVLMMLLTSSVLAAAYSGPRVPHTVFEQPHGRSLPQYQADWWSWVYQQPSESNPIFHDTTGKFCAKGQSGPVWFLGGTGGGAPITRKCTIPHSKDLFFPILNKVFCVPSGAATFKKQDEYILNKVVSFANPKLVKVTWDGEDLPENLYIYRRSPASPTIFKSDANDWSFPAGTGIACADNGWYIYMEAPSAGRHTLRIQGAIDLPDKTLFSLDVTYKLTIA